MGRSVSWWLGRIVTTTVMASLLVTTAGCKSLLNLKKKKDAGSTAPTPTALTGQDLADEQLQEKVDEYIKCLNALASSIHQSRHRYLSYVPRSGPTGREQFADLYRLPPGATATCSAGVSRAQLMPPPDAKLEASGREFSLAASEIDRLMNEMDTHYELKLFKDDRWLKGKAMHPRLMVAWDRFSRADKALHDTLDGITKPLAQRVLARIDREEGKKFRYHRKNVLITARELVESADPIGDDDDVDFNRYQAAYGEFEKGLDGLIAYGSMNRAELNDQAQAPNWPRSDSNYTSFIKEANDFKRSAKEFWVCLRDAPAKARTPSGKVDMDKVAVCGNMPAWKAEDQVIKQYNEFIRTSNGQQFP